MLKITNSITEENGIEIVLYTLSDGNGQVIFSNYTLNQVISFLMSRMLKMEIEISESKEKSYQSPKAENDHTGSIVLGNSKEEGGNINILSRDAVTAKLNSKNKRP